MLRKIRLILAVAFISIITLLFLDFTGTIHAWFGWMTKIQFLPALLALNVGIVLFLLALTFMFGRIYCSVICPLGVFSDILARIGKAGKKLPYSYSPEMSWLRYGVLAVFILAMVMGFNSAVALLAPYSSYGRIVNNLFNPLWLWGNNMLAYLAERANSYAFYETEVWMKSLSTLVIALVTFLILAVLAFRNGRTYCNTICPVGTLLGFVSRFSLFRFTIDTDKCNNCGLCARRCKAACINPREHKIDNSRCVVCMNCVDNCQREAITYKPVWMVRKKSDEKLEQTINLSRRRALSATILTAMAGTLKAQEKKIKNVEMKKDGGLAPIKERKAPLRQTPLAPPGALSVRNMTQHCVACQLCVTVCPNQVLSPSDSLMTLMQPEMSYERGYCRPECVKCSEVCPAGAIRPITKADKSAIQIGHAVWLKEYCVVNTDGVECGNCARHCPTEAIQMIAINQDDKTSHKIPVINTERCIGCGACENLCPSRPYSAIYVEGHLVHRII
ncbi:4Fe-4S binding protein [Parabacteroides provencensis]|uniref:4Fe-4S binding protein n=1 Tax=Parabacteroides provencensis TaxID=1944636 RepID=UPI000C14EF98|nr:4Fe-4S binding protein [Parabacteroides provencensis]